jgi:hypothetical protein
MWPDRAEATSKYTMPVLRPTFGVVLAIGLFGCSKYEGVVLVHPPTVEVSPGLPATATNAVLSLSIFEPADASPTNYRSATYGIRSLQYPGWSSSTIDGTNVWSQEARLAAIIPDGFEIRFTRCDNGVTQTNTVLFRFGETTQTSTIGFRIVGRYE